VARDVRLSFNEPPEQAIGHNDGYKLANSALLRDGIPSLPPGKTIRTFFDSFIERREKDLPMTYTVTVAYKDFTGKPMSAGTYVLDLRVYRDLLYMDRKGVHEMAKTLEAIQKEIHKWTEGIKGLRVYTTDLHNRRTRRWMRVGPLSENAHRAEKVRRRLQMWWNNVADRLGV
jgi:hypothetical protein